jgi:hypothetical protein
MRLAVQLPVFLYGNLERNYNGYAVEFVRQFRPVVYLAGLRNRATRGALFRYRVATKSTAFRHGDFEYAFSDADLNRKADVLVCFNGFPYREGNCPPRGFRGMKVFHAFEYVFRAAESNRALEQGGVDYLLGYADHSRHCAFFRHAYPRYVGKVIPVPFGFGQRFAAGAGPAARIPKVVAMGAVNPVDDPTVEDRGALADYRDFYRGERWTHAWRNMLREHESQLLEVMDSLLPKFPDTNNPGYDAVQTLRKYALFANDEGLMAFPPARTYEGVASGAAMVSSDHECFKELGFVDGENCVMHRKLDIADFREKVGWYLGNPDRLAQLAESGRKMVLARYSHEQVARDLFAAIQSRFQPV